MNEPRNLPPEKAEALRRRLYGHDHYLATSNASATGFTVSRVSSTSTPLHNAATEQHGNVSVCLFPRRQSLNVGVCLSSSFSLCF